MNLGLVIGRAFNGNSGATNTVVQLMGVEGSSETSVGRGVAGAPLGIQLYTYDERPITGVQLSRHTTNGYFMIPFRWDFLGSGGLPNDIFPFINLRVLAFTGTTLVPQTPVIRGYRFRGQIRNTPDTFLGLSGANVPIERMGAISMAIDCASMCQEIRASIRDPQFSTTLPNPLIGQTVLETQMLLGVVAIQLA